MKQTNRDKCVTILFSLRLRLRNWNQAILLPKSDEFLALLLDLIRSVLVVVHLEVHCTFLIVIAVIFNAARGILLLLLAHHSGSIILLLVVSSWYLCNAHKCSTS